MSTKTDITNSIDTIDDGGLNTAAEVRATLETLRDNAYGTSVYENYSNITDVTPNTTPFNSDLWYSLRFVKQGRIVSVNGFLYNRGSSIVTGEWFTFDATEYTPTTDIMYLNGITNTGSTVKCRISNDKLFIDSAVGSTTNVYLNFNYFTKD